MSIEDGALYQWFDGDSGGGDTDAMLTLLKRFWAAVAATFPGAWDAPPRRSRLVHGVGIVALGCVMDEIAYELRHHGVPSARQFEDNLGLIADACAWTDGVWALTSADRRRWNELQNIPRDIKALSDYLVRLYRSRLRSENASIAA